MKKIAIINLLILFILSSCDPKSCSEYIVENKLTENIEIILYQDSTITKSNMFQLNLENRWLLLVLWEEESD
jgi:hypothetical protein